MERSGVAQVKVFNLSLLALCDTPTERQLDNMLYTEMQFLIPVHHDQCSGLQRLGKSTTQVILAVLIHRFEPCSRLLCKLIAFR